MSTIVALVPLWWHESAIWLAMSMLGPRTVRVPLVCLFCLSMYTQLNGWSSMLGLYTCVFHIHVCTMHIFYVNGLFPKTMLILCYYVYLGHTDYLFWCLVVYLSEMCPSLKESGRSIWTHLCDGEKQHGLHIMSVVSYHYFYRLLCTRRKLHNVMTTFFITHVNSLHTYIYIYI